MNRSSQVLAKMVRNSQILARQPGTVINDQEQSVPAKMARNSQAPAKMIRNSQVLRKVVRNGHQ